MSGIPRGILRETGAVGLLKTPIVLSLAKKS